MNAAAGSSINADAIGTVLDETPCPEHGADKVVARIAEQQSGPVDVLAEMQSDIDALEQRVLAGEFTLSRGYDKVNRLRGLRDAMAELIEAGRSMSKYIGSGLPVAECFVRKARLDIALANVGSAS
jgi:hypothetical protein